MSDQGMKIQYIIVTHYVILHHRHHPSKLFTSTWKLKKLIHHTCFKFLLRGYMNLRMIESQNHRLEKTSKKIVAFKHTPDTTTPTKPYAEVPHLHFF